MYIQVENDRHTNETRPTYGDEGLNLLVVDSNRIRKCFNNVLPHIVKSKSVTPGSIVTCSAKGSTLAFSFHRAADAKGNPLAETNRYVKNPQAHRSSSKALGLGLDLDPAKIDELGHVDHIDRSEFSTIDAMSHSSNIATLNLNPASPRGASAHFTFATRIDAAAVAARLPAAKTVETKASISTADSLHESSQPEPANASVPQAKSAKTPTATPASVFKTTLPVKASVKSEIAGIEASKAERAKTEQETAKTTALKSDFTRTTQTKPSVAPSRALADTSTKTATSEPMTVLAKASPFTPTRAINGPVPAPVVASSKATASPQTTVKAAATPAAIPAMPPKILTDEEVAKLKAEAEEENLEPACGACAA